MPKRWKFVFLGFELRILGLEIQTYDSKENLWIDREKQILVCRSNTKLRDGKTITLTRKQLSKLLCSLLLDQAFRNTEVGDKSVDPLTSKGT